jgi:hypothetical protein
MSFDMPWRNDWYTIEEGALVVFGFVLALGLLPLA